VPNAKATHGFIPLRAARSESRQRILSLAQT
jgi:hypothetical protein